MFAQILGETTCGIDGVQILVEVDVSNGLPSFDLVGLPAMAVRESKERVKAALREDGLECESFNAALLHEPWEVRTGQGDPPENGCGETVLRPW